MTPDTFWTAERAEYARRLCAEYHAGTLGRLCERLTVEFGRLVTIGSLRKAFSRRGWQAPSEYAARPTAPSVERVAASELDFDDVADTTPQHRPTPVSPIGPPDSGKADPERMLYERAADRTQRRLKGERDALLDELAEAKARASFLDAIGEQHPPRIIPRETASGLREGTAVALASDWHVEETVRPESVAGRNGYNLEVSTRRARKFFASVRWLLAFERQAFTLRDLVLWIGGDIITGAIHEELVETNELSPVEAVLHAKQLLADGLATLLADERLERIVVPCSYGNHGRTTTKRRIKTGAQNSFEWLMYQVLRREFADEPRVEFVTDQSAHQYVEAYGDTLHFHHGDEVRYWGGVGGLSIPLNKRVPMWNGVRTARYHHVGHFHQMTDLGSTVVNGSLIGYSEYAMAIGAAYEPPQQAFYVLDSRRGKCLVTPLWVDEEPGT